MRKLLVSWSKIEFNLFVYACESVKGYLPSSLHFQGYLQFQYHLDIEIFVTDCHTFGFT